MNHFRSLSLVVAALLLGTPAARAVAPSEQVPVGPRAIAMGGAYSSLADDASALFWNPAGLPWIGHQVIAGTHADLFGSGIQDNLISFVLPLTPRHTLATDWYHSGFDDGELGFGENRFDVSYGYKWRSLLSAGATAKYLTRDTKLDDATVRQGKGVGMDLGVIVSPIPRLRLGLVGQDVFGTKLTYSEGGTTLVYPRNLRAAASYSWRDLGTLAFDVDDRYHLGAEVRPLELIALRGGLEKDRSVSSSEGATFTAGLGLKVDIFRFDYAFVQPPTLSATHHFGLSMEFNFNPSQIRIERVEPKPIDIYSSLYKSYATDTVATATITNLQDRAISATVKVYVPEVMEKPSEQKVQLYPKHTHEVALTSTFTEKAMSIGQGQPVEVQISTTYQGPRLERTEKTKARGYVYGPGAIDWGKGVEQAAAFVTSEDPAIDAFAGTVARTVGLMPRDPFGNRNISHAAAVFDALSTLGFAYVEDPNNPYKKISRTEKAVDTIRYPRATLAKLKGDCDDTSVLLAALLENIGIATKLVDVPGHLFLLFDSGIHARNRLGLALNENLYVVDGDEVWIPLETTAIGRGFSTAWSLGSDVYSNWASQRQVSLVDVGAAQARFEPALPPGAVERPAPVDNTLLTSRLEQDAGTVAAWRSQYLSTRYGHTREGIEVSPQALSEMARVDLVAGDFAAARGKLDQILAKDPRSALARNNRAVTYAAEGDLTRAAEQLERAIEVDGGDAGVWLNLGLVRFASGDSLGARRPLDEGLRRSGGYTEACRLLGLSPRQEPLRRGAETSAAEALRMLLDPNSRRAAPPSIEGGRELRPYYYWKG